MARTKQKFIIFQVVITITMIAILFVLSLIRYSYLTGIRFGYVVYKGGEAISDYFSSITFDFYIVISLYILFSIVNLVKYMQKD